MATIAPSAVRSAPAITWEVEDGIATVVLDVKGHPVNVISRAVKDESPPGDEEGAGQGDRRADGPEPRAVPHDT